MTIRDMYDSRRFTTVNDPRVIIPQPATRIMWKHLLVEKNLKDLPIFPSPLLGSPLLPQCESSNRFIDNPRRRREGFSRLLHHHCTLEGLARSIIQSRDFEAAGISAGCRPSWWGSKAGEGKYAFSRLKQTRFSLQRERCILLCLLCYLIAQHRVLTDDNNPYQFSFNIVDFQHRYEKKGISIEKKC